MYKAILFDLDGTLTDSGEGITKSVQYALEKLGHPVEDLSELNCFVGPPLVQQFMSFAGFDEETARQAVVFFRERYVPIGLYENFLYPGIKEVLTGLKARGFRLAVASSKLEVSVNKVLDTFGIADAFEVVVGGAQGGKSAEKKEVVEEALRRLGFDDRRQEVILVGDTHYDVIGAHEAGLDCLAVTYGYGDPVKVEASKPLAYADTPEEILDFFAETPGRSPSLTTG